MYSFLDLFSWLLNRSFTPAFIHVFCIASRKSFINFIIRKSNFLPNSKRSVRKSNFHIKRSVLKNRKRTTPKMQPFLVAFLVSTNRLKQALKWHSNISRKPLLSQQKCVSLFSIKPPYYREFHPAFYTALCLCTWQNSSCVH